jgi:hypothetical protein
MDIPAHVQTALGVAAQVSEEELAIAADATGFIQDVFGLTGQEFASSANLALSYGVQFYVIIPTRSSRAWRYLELLNLGIPECRAVCTPEASAEKPPTAAGQVLAAAWFINLPIIADTAVKDRLVVSYYASTMPPTFSSRLVHEWAEICPLFEGVLVQPVWLSNNQITITGDARIKLAHTPSLRFEELFLEAVSEVKTKWRFLSTYRVLEHGYLTEVFQKLQNGFFASPQENLSAALNSLESELKQFIALVEAVGIKSYFETFYDEFEKVKLKGNRFSAAIENSIMKSGQIKQVQGKWQKGVLIYYKIRCAIVHAGVGSPIFDAYPDGKECLDELLPTCELLMLKFLGLSVA